MAKRVSTRVLGDGCVVILIAGMLDANECRTLLAKAIHHQSQTSTPKVVLDLRGSQFKLSKQEVTSLARSYDLEELYQHHQIGVIANRGLQTGLLRFFIELTQPGPGELGLFEDEFAAQTWLGL
jgi:hypothetical protein